MKRSRIISTWSAGFACPRVTSGGFTVIATRGFGWSWTDRRWYMPWTPTPRIPGRSPWMTCYPIGPPESRRAKPPRKLELLLDQHAGLTPGDAGVVRLARLHVAPHRSVVARLRDAALGLRLGRVAGLLREHRARQRAGRDRQQHAEQLA